MKATLFVSVALFAIMGVSKSISPITSFSPGNYIGAGSWLGDDGSSGDYAEVLSLQSSGWESIQVRGGNIYIYETALNIDANGFFQAQVTDDSDPSNPVVYSGYGNCGSWQCDLTVALSNGTLQKSMIFHADDNVIYSYGAITFNDGTPNVQWEGAANLVSSKN